MTTFHHPTSYTLAGKNRQSYRVQMYPLAINGIIIIPFVYCILQLDKTLYLCNILIISATRKAIKFNQLARHVDPKFLYFRLMISTVKP